MQRMIRKRFGDILVESGLVTPTQIQRALEYGQAHNIKLGQSLKELGLVDDLTVAKTIARQLAFPYVDFDKIVIDPQAVRLIPEVTARKYKLIALGRRPGEILVAFADPLNIFAIDEVSKILEDKLVLCVAVEERIAQAIDQYYQSGRESTIKGGDSSDDEFVDSKVIELVNELMLAAMNEDASDVHIEPVGDKVRVRFRVDGLLRVAREQPIDMLPAIVSRIKILSRLDIGERRKPQDGRFELPISGRAFDIRVSTLPLNDGEKVVMRLLDKAKVKVDLKFLGFEPEQQRIFEKHLRRPHEIILVTGPTGSGKTTTLYGALNLINSVDKNIITVEDPVEYELMGVNQVQTNLKAGRTFASSLRSILRQDPDVIMIGEIRDAETAEIATQAALTGHLVLSTLHTNDASGAISRLVEMGIPPFLIASSLGLVLSQRLLRRLCLHCRQKYEMAATLRQDFGLTVEQAASCYQSVGCNECDHSGYRGRVAIYEVFAMSKEIERLIMANASSRDIYRQAMAEGLVSLRQAGINKMLEGLTSASEVYRVSMEEME